MGKSILRATGIILMMNMAVKILGFLRETFLANAFGATATTDAYLIAYTLPYFLQAILGCALVTAVVPILTRHLVAGNKDEAWYVGSGIINITFVLLTLIALIGIAITGILVKIMAPGFDGEVLALAIDLARIMFPSVVFMGVGMVITGICNASYRFAVPAFAPGLSSLIIIASIVLFAGVYGVYGLAVGTLVSFIGFMLIQIPVLWRLGFKYKFTLALSHPDIKQVLREILPIILGVAVNQIYFAINRAFASGLIEGSISALNYANKLMMLPLGIFVAAIASAIYPSLTELAISNDHKKMAATLKRGLGSVCLIAIPAAVGLCVLAEPIVRLLFERGAFDHQATLATARALICFTIGLVPMAANMVLTRAYYALGDVKTPVRIGACSIAINIVLSVILLKPMAYGGGGLALSNSLAALTGTLLLYFYLKKHHLQSLAEGSGGNMGTSLLKMGVSAVIMGLAVWGVSAGLQSLGLNPLTGSGSLILVAAGVGAGILVYVIAIFALKVDETQFFIELIRKKLKKS